MALGQYLCKYSYGMLCLYSLTIPLDKPDRTICPSDLLVVISHFYNDTFHVYK
jgi:hypothetical protein